MAKKKKTPRQKTQGKKFLPDNLLDRKKILVTLASVLALIGLVFGIRYFFINSPFFTIKEVVVNSEGEYSLKEAEKKIKDRYTGLNIFTVDLRQVTAGALSDFPHLKKVEARRALPDKLEVSLLVRTPVAFIDTGDGMVIDKDGMVLASGMETRGLVKIKGLNFFWGAPSPGKNIKTRPVTMALLLLEVLREKDFTKRYGIEYIDVSDQNNILLNIDGVLVKMGNTDFSRKINRLNEILKDPRMDLKDINYIDLRFEDAVISPK